MSILEQSPRAALLARPGRADATSTGLSIIIPAFNEERGIGPVVEQVRGSMEAAGQEYEILVVDDGSVDRTAEAARESEVRVVRHRHNRGYGEALKTGIRHASFERIAIIDADGSYPAQEIPRLASLLDEAEMVVGARTGSGAAIPLLRRPAKWLLTRLASYLTGIRIPDLNSGLRLFRRALAIEFFDLLPSGFSFTTTITLAALNSGYLVEYVPIDYYQRTGRSKIRPIQDTLNFFLLVLRLTLTFRPLKIYLPLGGLFLLFAVLVLIVGWYGFGKLFDNTVMLLVMLAIQAAMIGMLADVVNVRRNRPP
ncbi:MAG TPA: glycosyltransferase family 2 protein [Chloroflexota bacterium]|nr:glycosyltransferase family 2 protein [Chloroflexota bacterium]